MTISDAIDQVKGMRPGTPYTDAVFLGWMNDLETDIQTKVFLLKIEDVEIHAAKTEEVLADAAHTKIYWSWLCAMIDLAAGEMTRYQDDVKVFNQFFNEYRAWYGNTYHPGNNKAQELGYYLSAYAIAVKYGYDGTEEEWNAAVNTAKTAAETAQAAAETAQEAAETAQGLAETARDAAAVSTAEAAATASSVEAYAGQAADSATAAAESASTAATKADEAAASATAAADSAIAAAASATAAGASESNAATAKAAAEAAQQAAETAKTAAETAQGLAETAKTAAETAKSDAQSAKTAAETAQSAAEAAQGLAETASTAAQGAQTAAEAAQNAAESALTGAETAKITAEQKAADAEAWAVGQRGGVEVGTTDPTYHNNAKWYKEQAREIAGGDYATKTEAQGYADTAKSEAISAAAEDATTKAAAAASASDPAGTAGNTVSAHNTNENAHSELFTAKAAATDLTAHTSNGDIHVMALQKLEWSGKAGKGEAFIVTLTAAGWSSNTQTVNNDNFATSGYGYIVSPAPTDFEEYGTAIIRASDVTTAGQMTFTCMETPTQAITVNILRIEVSV